MPHAPRMCDHHALPACEIGDSPNPLTAQAAQRAVSRAAASRLCRLSRLRPLRLDGVMIIAADSPHPAPRFEKRIEIQRKIFLGHVRDRTDDGKGDALRLSHLTNRGTLHIKRYGAGEAAEVLLFDRPAHHHRQRDHRTVSHRHSNLRGSGLDRAQHRLFADDRCSGLTPGFVESPRYDAGRHDHISDRRRWHECAGKSGGNRQCRAMPTQDRARRGVRRLRSDARGNKPIRSTGVPAGETAHTVDLDPSLDGHGAPYGGQLPSCRGEQNDGT